MCYLSVLCWFSLSHFFFFKQKTAYEMRISDWSSDVCSSDLGQHPPGNGAIGRGNECAPLRRRQHPFGVGIEHALRIDRELRKEVTPILIHATEKLRMRHALHTRHRFDLRPQPHRPDRKSTRLNSSH